MAIRRYRGDLLLEEWNADSGLYRRFNTVGGAIQQRPLTAAELTRVQDYDRAVAEADAIDQAKQQVDTIHADTPAYQSQIAADIASVQAGGWQALDGDTQTAIVLRMLSGFTAVMSGLLSHAAVTGAIDPLDTPTEAS